LLGENKGAVATGVGVGVGPFCVDVAVAELRAWGVSAAFLAVLSGLGCVRLKRIWPENTSNDRPISTKSDTKPTLE
jgi:hypothetical protein